MTRRERQDRLGRLADNFEFDARDFIADVRLLAAQLKRHRPGDGLPYTQIDATRNELLAAIQDLNFALSDALSTGNSQLATNHSPKRRTA